MLTIVPKNKGNIFLTFYFIFLKILFIYLTGRETAREGTQAGRVAEGEAASPLSKKPDARLNPRTPGS